MHQDLKGADCGAGEDGSATTPVLVQSFDIANDETWNEVHIPRVIHMVSATPTQAVHDVGVHRLTFRTPNVNRTASATNIVSFYGATDVDVGGNYFFGNATTCAKSGGWCTQDATAMLASSRYLIHDNHASGFFNACFDNWSGNHDFALVDNACDADGKYGILVNGLSSPADSHPLTTSDGLVVHNRVANASAAGMLIAGLANKEADFEGLDKDIYVIDNEITGAGLGLRLATGEALAAIGNTISGAKGTAIDIRDELAKANTRNVLVAYNDIDQCNAGQHADADCITISLATSDVYLLNNTVTGSKQRYTVAISNWRTPPDRTEIYCDREHVMEEGQKGAFSLGGTKTILHADRASRR